jgi:serine phosphatase RsbU (regulator of sigma subunit)/anti-sigma regulatory factor (Ser/Thr protein kinase)
MHPRIRTQAYLVAALPLAFLIVLLGLALAIQDRSRAGAAFEQHTQAALEHVDAARSVLAGAGRAGGPAQVDAAREKADANFAALRALVRDDRGVPVRELRLEHLIGRAFMLIKTYVTELHDGRATAARDLAASPSTRDLSARLSSAFDDVTSAERRLELARLDALRRAIRGYLYALVAVCIAAIVLTLSVSGQFGLRIAQRLELLGENARRMARGEPTETMRGSDEFTQLDGVYQEMMRRIAREHRISSTLQNMLLPQRLPDIPGVRIDTVYVPAAQDAEVGGDWYDVFPLSGHRICVTIGDVAGHGLQSAAVMAGARLAIRTAARIDERPASIMSHVNRIVSQDEPGTIVSAIVAVLDLRNGSFDYAVAGHPEPMIVRANGDVDFLHGKGLVLGADSRASYDTFHEDLTEGSAILLYTDGLVEVEHDFLAGIEELLAAARAQYITASENIAEAIQRRVLRGRRSGDDAALLFIGITSLQSSGGRENRRTWELDARDATSAWRTKRAVLWYLSEALSDETQLATAELIVGELLGNVARHSPGRAQVIVQRGNGTVTVSVSDRGAPFHAGGGRIDPMAESGRGLFLIRSLAQDVRIEHTGSGNTVSVVLSNTAPLQNRSA